MISKIQRSRRQFCDVTITGSFQTGLETNIYRRLQCPSQLSTPLYSQLILRIYAAMNVLGGVAKTEFAPGAGNHRYATASKPGVLHRRPSHCAAYRFYRSTVVFSFFVSGSGSGGSGSGSGWRNSRFHILGKYSAFKGLLTATATVACKYSTFKRASNSNCNV